MSDFPAAAYAVGASIAREETARAEVFTEVYAVYQGSSGDRTRDLYARLEALGSAGALAVNLFRATKTSERAKLYRGGNKRGRYRAQAYETKQWALDNLTKILTEHAEALGMTWGWAEDPKQEFHRWVLYVDLPTGQVSWHTDGRGTGPDYLGHWDGMKGHTVDRVCRWCARLLAGDAA